MREKLGALIQFLGIIIGFAMVFGGLCAAYQSYFGSEDLAMARVIAETVADLVIALIGAGVMVGGTVVGTLLKK